MGDELTWIYAGGTAKTFLEKKTTSRNGESDTTAGKVNTLRLALTPTNEPVPSKLKPPI